jgi:hypothetical protein
MKHREANCQRQGCGYDLTGLEVVSGRVVCPECGEVNRDTFLTPFPSLQRFMHLISKPWYFGVIIGALFALPIGQFTREYVLCGLTLPMSFFFLLYLGTLWFSRRSLLRVTDHVVSVPGWAWNGFLMLTAIWTFVFWGVVFVAMSVIL